MADQYVGSVQYAAVAQFAVSTAYVVGDIVRQLAAPAVNNERCFRCTTAGTSGGTEPAWNLSQGATTNTGTATFTEVTGNPTYNWAAPCARGVTAILRVAATNDNIYFAQNHAETQASTIAWAPGFSVNLYCVNAAGSVPPVAADLVSTPTGTVSTTGASSISISSSCYIYGLTFTAGNSTNNASIIFGNQIDNVAIRLNNCALVLGGNHANGRISIDTNSIAFALEWNNTTVAFAHVTQSISWVTGQWKWNNTPSALQGATVPTILITPATTNVGTAFTAKGVDFSAVSTSLFTGASSGTNELNLVNCRLHASGNIFSTGPAGSTCNIIISDSSNTTYRQERRSNQGTLTTELTYTMVGGASDGTTAYSWKIVTGTSPRRNFPFSSFPLAVWNTTVGTPINVTVELENGGLTLTDAEIWVEFEYLGNASYPISSVVSTGPATPLTTGANLPTSSATWNGGLGSAVKQYMQASLTAQLAGYIRAIVYVARASTTIYVNPKIVIT